MRHNLSHHPYYIVYNTFEKKKKKPKKQSPKKSYYVTGEFSKISDSPFLPGAF